MCAEFAQENKLNLKAPEFCPKNYSNPPSRFDILAESHNHGLRPSGSSSSSLKDSRRRSQSLSIQLEARRPVYRVKVSNFSPEFNKAEFIDMMRSKFTDIKSIDFQPRYHEKGRLFGFILFESQIGYDECLQIKTLPFYQDLLRFEPGLDKGCIPTSTTLVISNLPVQLTVEAFNDWIMQQVVRPISFTFHNIHRRSIGKGYPSGLCFSGTVYVQYRNIEDSGIAWGYFIDEMIGGRKIVVEYKKKQDKTEFDRNNDTVFLSPVARQLWLQMVQFKNTYAQSHSASAPSLVFPNNLSPLEKSIVFTYTEKLGLCHYTKGEGDAKSIFISTTPPTSNGQTPRSGRSSRAGSLMGDDLLKEELPQRRPRRMSCPDFMQTPVRRGSVSLQSAASGGQRVALGPDDNGIGFRLQRHVCACLFK